jgi:DNA-directed RNA polymerase subunit RPC12/RpoP
MICPGCASAMEGLSLEGHVGATAPVNIDVCHGCQAFWFDAHESLQLGPGSTLRLFQMIAEASSHGKTPISTLLRCPRCRMRLLLTNDLQRNTHFSYWRCDRGDGRFITFFNFLREKDFIRPLSPQQIEELRRNVQSVNCSNCGGPVDLAKESACPHCGTPLSMLDLKQTADVVAQLQHAAEPRPIDPALPLALAQARSQVDALFGSDSDAGWGWKKGDSSLGLVEAGLAALRDYLTKPKT